MYTDTLERNYLGKEVDFDKIEEDHTNCISLYDLISSFNKMHMAFMKEYNELDKLYLGSRIEVKGFTKITDSEGNVVRILDVFVRNPIMIREDYTYLYLREINGVSKPYITNDMGLHSDKGYYRQNIKLDNNKVTKLLDLFEKYQLLFDLYKYLRSQVVYGDGTFHLITRIDGNKDKFVDKMNNFRVSLSSNHVMNQGNQINIKVNLGNELEIDLDNSRINLGGEEIEPNKDICMDILKRVFVNGKYLEKQSDNKELEEENSKVKMLVNNI
jgi:hypothetical protein